MDLNCKQLESIHDEADEWIIGFIQKCEVTFDPDTNTGRFEVKILDGPLRLNHIRDSRWIDCAPADESKQKQTNGRDDKMSAEDHLPSEMNSDKREL